MRLDGIETFETPGGAEMAIFCLELKRISKSSVDEMIKNLRKLMDLVDGEVSVVDNDPLKQKTTVMVKYDECLIEKRMNQKVGHPTKAMLEEVDLKDLEKRIKERGAKAVAEDLGVGRATLFRKLKKARESGSDIVE